MTCSPRPIARSTQQRAAREIRGSRGGSSKRRKIEVPRGLKKKVRAILAKHDDLRWDDAIRLVLDETQLDRVRAEKEKAKKKSGDFTDADDAEDDEPPP